MCFHCLSWRRHRLCLAFPLPSRLRHRLFPCAPTGRPATVLHRRSLPPRHRERRSLPPQHQRDDATLSNLPTCHLFDAAKTAPLPCGPQIECLPEPCNITLANLPPNVLRGSCTVSAQRFFFPCLSLSCHGAESRAFVCACRAANERAGAITGGQPAGGWRELCAELRVWAHSLREAAVVQPWTVRTRYRNAPHATTETLRVPRRFLCHVAV